MNKYGIVTFYPVEKAIEDMITVHATCMAILQYASQYVHEDGEKLIIKMTEGRERDG